MSLNLEPTFESSRPEPATLGSYGVAPTGYRLPDGTRLGPVSLQVSDLRRSLAYYEQVLGLVRLHVDAGSAVLGTAQNNRKLVTLTEHEGARTAGRGLLGLYHFAILLPDRPSLARFVQHLSATGVRAGAADHLVSEAFYLTDPDGLGIEVYVDRPRSSWKRLGRELVMTTDPIDRDSLITSAGEEPWAGMPEGTVIGHVHLHVGDLGLANAFFSEALGFDRMTWRYPGALFLGAGGYHHHLGANTWAGLDARPPDRDDARLLEWTVGLPTQKDVIAVAKSLRLGGYRTLEGSGAVTTWDPWGTALRVYSLEAERAEL